MKKTLSLLLCVLTVISLWALTASAAGTENVAAGLTSYTINGLYTDADGKLWYPDENGKSLTNNVFAQSADYGDMEFIGLNSTSEFAAGNESITTIELDLGEVYPIVTAVVSCSNLGIAGINLPKAVTVTVSADGENWSDPIAAEYEVDEPVAGEVIKAIAEVNAEIRYITYHFDHASNWVFVDEIQAFAGDISSKDAVPEESDKQTGSKEESKNNTANGSVAADDSAPASNDSSDTNGGDNTWIYVVCAVAAVVAFIITVILKKKK